jgi:hypothetical protein
MTVLLQKLTMKTYRRPKCKDCETENINKVQDAEKITTSPTRIVTLLTYFCTKFSLATSSSSGYLTVTNTISNLHLLQFLKTNVAHFPEEKKTCRRVRFKCFLEVETSGADSLCLKATLSSFPEDCGSMIV